MTARTKRLAYVWGAAILLALLSIGCAKREDPEQRIRGLIGKAEQAVEKKEIAELRGYISERYADEDGRDRRAIEGILRLYVLRHDAIHLLTRIDSVAFPQPKRAKAVVYVAMAGRPIAASDDLRSFNANLYRFELEFAEEGKQWRVARAAWRPAEPVDFIR
jgi:hypothetical protein